MNGEPKKRPSTVRFGPAEEKFLDETAVATGLPTAELVRRSIRLLRRQAASSKGFSFLIDLAA